MYDFRYCTVVVCDYLFFYFCIIIFIVISLQHVNSIDDHLICLYISDPILCMAPKYSGSLDLRIVSPFHN